jgi:hypothetical protein
MLFCQARTIAYVGVDTGFLGGGVGWVGCVEV